MKQDIIAAAVVGITGLVLLVAIALMAWDKQQTTEQAWNQMRLESTQPTHLISK